MSKTKCLLLAAAAAALAFTFSCSSDDGGGDEKFSYCILSGEQMCLDGPFTSKDCNANGGKTSNSCPYGGGGSSSSGGSNSFETVTIGNQTWMAKNLDSNVPGSKCYGEGAQVRDDNYNYITLSSSQVQTNCTRYGRLYNWATAKNACPSGWRLPSNADWSELLRWVDERNGGEGEGSPYFSYTAGRHLRATSGWNGYGSSTDKYEFSALPGGYYRDKDENGENYGKFENVGNDGNWWSADEVGGSYAFEWFIEKGEDSFDWYTSDKSDLLSVRCVKNASSSGGGGVSGGLFCADGEAWIRNNSGGDNGFLIRSNGECFELEMHSGNWYFEESFSCSVSEDTFTLSWLSSNGSYKTETYTYSLSGDQLTAQKGNSTDVYTKTSGIYPLNP